MEKPRIKMLVLPDQIKAAWPSVVSGWTCTGSGYQGFGSTAAEAWRNWDSLISFHERRIRFERSFIGRAWGWLNAE